MVNGQLSAAERHSARLTEFQGSTPGTAAREALGMLSHLPQPGSESWKYSPVNRLYEALENGPSGSASDTDIAALLAQADTTRFPLIAAAALELASVTRVQLGNGDRLEPESFAAQEQGCHWLHVEVAEGATAQLIQRGGTAKGLAAITTIELKAGATLNHSVSGASNSGTAWHLHSIDAGEHSHYHRHQLSLGGQLERNDVHVRLVGRDAQATLTGTLLCGDKDRSDNQIVLEHQAPNCRSTARYHGLANQQGKLTFGGRIHILPEGAGTDARLHNPNLLLADTAEINTKPELEIYNDDVACAHGATVGQLNDDAVFYLRSRGIPLTAARALLLRGFVGDGLGGPDQDYMTTLTNARLTQWTL